MKRIIFAVVLIAIATSVHSQVWYGPADTVKIPLWLADSVGNPTPVDSAADSMLVRVIREGTVNTGGDTCFLLRGLLDASTNSSIRTTASLTFGGRVVHTFTFFKTAYALTNSATSSGEYTVMVMTWDASPYPMWNTRSFKFNYVYGNTASAGVYSFAMFADTLVNTMRWLSKSIMPDSTTAGYIKTDVYSINAQTTSASGTITFPAGTIVKTTDTVNMAGQYTKIKDSVLNSGLATRAADTASAKVLISGIATRTGDTSAAKTWATAIATKTVTANVVATGSYVGGAVWIDTIVGTSSGTTSWVNGLNTNPVKRLTDALTIASNLTIRRFQINNGSTIVLGTTYSNYDFFGSNWTLQLGGQAISNSEIAGANVSGTCTGTMPHFTDCIFGASTLPPSYLYNCGLDGTITVGSAGAYHFINCNSDVAGAGTPTLDMGGAVGATTAEFRKWSGGLRLLNIQAGDTISVDAVSGGKIRVYGTGGSINVRGMVWVEDSSGGSVSITKTQVINTNAIALASDSTNNLKKTDTAKMTGQYTRIKDSILASGLATRTKDTILVSGLATRTADTAAAKVLTSGIATKTKDTVLASGLATRTADTASAKILTSGLATRTADTASAKVLTSGLATKTKDTTLAAVVDSANYGDKYKHMIAAHSDSGATITVGNVGLAPGEYTKIADSVGTLGGTSNWSDAQRDSLIARVLALRDTSSQIHTKLLTVADSVNAEMTIFRSMAPMLTLVRDSINAVSTWLDPTLDSMLYAYGYKIGSRSVQGRAADCDTLHVKIGTNPYFKMLFYHVGGTAGATPDSTLTVDP